MLIQAPAGYGKTTATADRLGALGADTAWVRLDEQDNDPGQFAQYVVHALHSVRPVLSDVIQNLEGGTYPSLQAVLTDVLAQLPLEDEPLYLVLDDYHSIHSPDIHQALEFLLKHHPPYLTLIVLSRTLPPIGIAQLRMQGRLLEITARDLAFTADEAEAYFRQRLHYGLSRETVERITRRAEGWIAALQLAAASASTQQEFDAFTEQLPQGNQHIFNYFDELLSETVSEDERHFLLRTSILERFNAFLVMRVTAQPDDQVLLTRLLNLGLFMIPVDTGGLWYRYHSLFATYLRHLLSCTLSEEASTLHLRACEAWLELGRPEEAAHHAIASGDQDRVAGILLEHGRHFLSEGRFSLLQRCLDTLDRQRVTDHPALTLLRAWVAQSQYQFAEVESWLTEAERRIAEHGDPDELKSARAEFDAVRAQVAMNFGNPRQALELAEAALAADVRYLNTSFIAANSVLGEAHFVLGHLNRAMAQMQQTEQLARQHGAHQNVIWALCQQSEIAVAQGFLQKAYNFQEKAFQYVEENALEHLPILEFLYRIRAQILFEWYHLDNAETCALKGIEILENQGERWYIQNYVILARIAQALGKQNLCAEYIHKIQKMLAAGDYHLDWVANAHATMLNYWDAVRDQEAIQRWLTAAPPFDPATATNHFQQCNARNYVRAYTYLGQYERAEPILAALQRVAEQYQLRMDMNRNLIQRARLQWLQEQREAALDSIHEALQLASTTGAVASFLRMGKMLINLLKALLAERELSDMERQRAERLVQLSQQQRDFSRAIRITLDEAIIQDIIDRPDVPELIRTSPLTRREWQVLSLIHAGLSNDQIAEHLKVAPTTIKTHIRSLYQKQNITHRSEAIALARELLSKIQGD
ncbi:HTH-type transcriptional regulator MalT [Hahella sp. SMD15-11]|uniref:HTH-type transcriptional regulator MalT n=1 Tax=Thermohahella caldifontis TaxID=3142973 RepID=A0AB39USE5_9GAMM